MDTKTHKPKTFSSYKDAKEYAEKMEKLFQHSIGGGTAYWVSDEKMNRVEESVNEEVGINFKWIYKNSNGNKPAFFNQLSKSRKKFGDDYYEGMLYYTLKDYKENPDKYKTIKDKEEKLWQMASKTESVNEGVYEKIMQAIKKGMDGKTLTVMAIDTQTKKVVYQKDIPTIQKDLVPAYYKEIRAKYPSSRYIFAIENGTGKIIYKEGFPGGAGVGVSLPGGYINGAPKSKDVKKMKKNLR